MPEPRTIFHVDMDAFFAAIAELDDPSLAGKAVLTGGTGPRGVVTTASYEARKFGCHSAMPMSIALRRCPHAICVKVPGERIRELSQQVFAVLDAFSPTVQPLSVDEAFLDMTGTQRLMGPPEEVAQQLKDAIKQATGLTASVGVAFNKFLAKLASDLDKPDGLVVITPRNVDQVLSALPVSKVWGVGPSMEKKLAGVGIHTVADLRQWPGEALTQRFGSAGEHLHELAFGRDDRPVTPDRVAKSIGQEQTFDTDLASAEAARAFLLGHTEQVAERLRRHGFLARGVTLKLRAPDFSTRTRSVHLTEATARTDLLWGSVRDAFDQWAAASFHPLRLVGVTAYPLTTTPGQPGLFNQQENQKRERLDRATDAIRARFGKASITRAGARARSKRSNEG